MSAFELHRGDCLDVLKTLADASVDSIVTDPPYGIRFMGQSWDGQDIDARAAKRRSMQSHGSAVGPNGGHKSIAAELGNYDLRPSAMLAFQEFSQEWAEHALRVLKPGGHLLSFSSPRTYHRMVVGVEDAGFEIRDCIQWLFGSGFPKSHNGEWGGTALKPAHEPIVVARKPLIGTVANNWREHGTGALNIEGCRVGADERVNGPASGTSLQRKSRVVAGHRHDEGVGPGSAGSHVVGRWPANVIHDGSDEVLVAFPIAPGQQGIAKNDGSPNGNAVFGELRNVTKHPDPRADSGSAARFFYCAKASSVDRHEGLQHPAPQFEKESTPRNFEDLNAAGDKKGNHHPTVKPTALMQYLVRLVTPAGGTVLDPFMGSGSTGKACALEGFRFVGIDLDQAYVDIARARIDWAHRFAIEAAAREQEAAAQFDLFGKLA